MTAVMTNMQTEIFISIISDFLNSKASKRNVNIDWSEMLKIAKLHEATGIVHYQCKEFIPIEFKNQFDQSIASTIYFYTNRVKEEQTLLRELRDAGINCIIIKGSAVAAYYPVPSLRTMGDTDVVVDNAEIAHRVLIDAGYICKTKYAAYYKRDLLFEIHDQIAHETAVNSREVCDFFNDYKRYIKGDELDWSFHLLFLIFHMRTHFFGSGIGIRQFMDIATVTKNNKDLDWSWIETELKELDLWSFSQKVFDLNHRWFGIDSPLPINPVDEDFYKEATVELCLGGVFGHMENNARKVAVNGKNHPKLTMLMRAWKMVFVPYHNMILMPQYSFLIGKPYLLPVAWIYRGWLTIKKGGIKKTTQRISSNFVSQNEIEGQKEYINKWTR